MEDVKARLKANDLAGVKKAYLEYRRRRSPAKWTVMPSAMPPKATASSDVIGDEILRHHIRNSFYNFSPHAGDMGRDFNWAYNPVDPHEQGYSDEWTYCAISRTQFWEQLADAYWRTHDEKYAREWIAELEDFARKNPSTAQVAPNKPSLWRTLDSAIRMHESWPYAYYHFLDSPLFTPEAQWIYLREIQDHARLLEDSLKNQQRTGNWVTSEVYGLFSIATLYPEMKDAARWRQTALDRMKTELKRMVLPDGMEAELTPNYHMVALNGFRGILLLAEKNKIAIPDETLKIVLSMYRALVTVMDQRGFDVGTNDSPAWDAVAEARRGLQLAYDPVLDWAVSGGQRGKPLPDSTSLPYAGFYAMRSGWKPEDLFLFFRAGPTGIGHEHEDMLQVDITAFGKPLLLDAPNALYDHSDYRRFILGTEAHNTITIDGKWQHRGQTRMQQWRPARASWITTPLFDLAAGIYDGGYQKNIFDQSKEYQPMQWIGEIDHSVQHTRRVLFLLPYYALLLDTVDGKGTHTIESRFNVAAPAVRINPQTQAAFSENMEGAQLAIYPLERAHLQATVVQGEHGAPDIHWGVPTVQFRTQQVTPATLATFLYPYRGAQPEFNAEPLTVVGERTWGQRIHTGYEDVEVVIVQADGPHNIALNSALAGKVAAVAEGLTIRRAAGRQKVLIGAWNLDSLQTKDLTLQCDRPAQLLVTFDEAAMALMNAGNKPVRVAISRPYSTQITIAPSSTVELSAHGEKQCNCPSAFALSSAVPSSANTGQQ